MGTSDAHGFAKILTTGLTKKELNLENSVAGNGFAAKTGREACFPLDMVEAGLAFDILKAQASQPEDRVHILNFIAGVNDQNQEPPAAHLQYDESNFRLRSYFARTFLRRVLARASIDTESFTRENELFQKMVQAFSEDRWERNLTLDLRGTQIDSADFAVLKFPPQLERLGISCAHCKHVTDSSILFLSCNLPGTLTSLELGSLEGTQVSPATRLLCSGLDSIRALPDTLTVLISDVEEHDLPAPEELGDGDDSAPKRAYKAKTSEGVPLKISSDADYWRLKSLLKQGRQEKEEGEPRDEPQKVVVKIRQSSDEDLEQGFFVRSGTIGLLEE